MGGALRHVGAVAIIVAIGLSFAGSAVPGVAGALAQSPELPKNIGILGVVLLGVGLVLGRASRPHCQRCSRLAERGSVLCHQHHVELERQARAARTRFRDSDQSYQH